MQFKVSQRTDKVKVVEGKHYTLSCSNCSAPLVNILETSDDRSINWLVKAECPHCFDSSPIVKIESSKYHHGYVDAADGKGHYTEVYDIDYTENRNKEVVTVFKTKATRKWGLS